MAFQSTALIDSSIPRGGIKKIDRPSASRWHSSQQLYVKLKTQLKFKLFQSDGAPQPMFHLMELWWKSDARIQSANPAGWVSDEARGVRSCRDTRASVGFGEFDARVDARGGREGGLRRSKRFDSFQRRSPSLFFEVSARVPSLARPAGQSHVTKLRARSSTPARPLWRLRPSDVDVWGERQPMGCRFPKVPLKPLMRRARKWPIRLPVLKHPHRVTSVCPPFPQMHFIWFCPPLAALLYIKMSRKWKLSSGNFFQFMRANQGHARCRSGASNVALTWRRATQTRADRYVPEE